MSLSVEQKIAIVTEYFRLADSGDPKLMELFHDDVAWYFPKYGLGRGPSSILETAKGLQRRMQSIHHDYASFVFTPSGDRIVVEGMSTGTMVDGAWKGGETPGGRFCNVFEFRGDHIARLHVYLDPDYLGEDNARFLWGREGRRW